MAFAIQIIIMNAIDPVLKVSFGLRDLSDPDEMFSDGNILRRSPDFKMKSSSSSISGLELSLSLVSSFFMAGSKSLFGFDGNP